MHKVDNGSSTLKFQSVTNLLTCAGLVLFLSACGGGGGSSESEDSGPLTVVSNTIRVPTDTASSRDIQRTFYDVSGVFAYKSDRENYVFYSGTADWTAGMPTNDTINDIDPAPSQILKKVDGKWEFHKTDNNAVFWGIRNYEIIDDKVILGDGNEIGLDGPDWKGPAYFGRIGGGGNIDWTQVTGNSEMGFFHGTGAGDLNNDGLIDIGVTPGIMHAGINIFLQNPNGTFTRNDSILNWSGPIPFAIDFADVVGDARDEIITADYGGGSAPDADDHEIKIYKYDDVSMRFELFYQNNEPNIYTWGLGATSIKVHDFDNDGINDIAVAREDLAAHGFEVWKGLGNQTFEVSFSSPTWSQDELQFREFSVFDANNDGFLDILLRPFHYGTLYRVAENCWWNVEACDGIKLNHLIWLNNGDASFSHYDAQDLTVPDIVVDNVFPYKDGDNLHFVGTYTPDWDRPVVRTIDIKVELDN